MFLFEVKNEALDLPKDLLYPLLYPLAFAIIHYCCVKFLLNPLALYLLPPPLQQQQQQKKPSLAHSDSGIGINDSGENKSIRNRNKSTTTSTTTDENDTVEKVKDENIVTRRKFVISSWRFIQYTACVILGFFVLRGESWATDPSQFFANWPHEMNSNLKVYYSVGFGLNAYAIFDLFVQPRQKDFPAMLTHHITTVFLIYESYIWGCQRIGSVILLLHDIADPLMEIAKACLYAKKQFFADAFITLFAISFFVTRLYVFPMYVISSIPLYAYWDDGSLLPSQTVNRASFAALSILQCLHIYWGFLILQVVWKAIMSGAVQGDVRDEDEE